MKKRQNILNVLMFTIGAVVGLLVGNTLLGIRERTPAREETTATTATTTEVTETTATTEQTTTTTEAVETTATTTTTVTTTEMHITTTVTETTDQSAPRKFKREEGMDTLGRREIYLETFEKMKTEGGNFPDSLRSVHEWDVFEKHYSRDDLKEKFFEHPIIEWACKTKYNKWVILIGWDEETGVVTVITEDGEEEYSAETIFGEEITTLLPEM